MYGPAAAAAAAAGAALTCVTHEWVVNKQVHTLFRQTRFAGFVRKREQLGQLQLHVRNVETDVRDPCGRRHCGNQAIDKFYLEMDAFILTNRPGQVGATSCPDAEQMITAASMRDYMRAHMQQHRLSWMQGDCFSNERHMFDQLHVHQMPGRYNWVCMAMQPDA
jgi:hypothetical protein